MKQKLINNIKEFKDIQKILVKEDELSDTSILTIMLGYKIDSLINKIDSILDHLKKLT